MKNYRLFIFRTSETKFHQTVLPSRILFQKRCLLTMNNLHSFSHRPICFSFVPPYLLQFILEPLCNRVINFLFVWKTSLACAACVGLHIVCKVIYFKYYKHSNESCIFASFGQIGPSRHN